MKVKRERAKLSPLQVRFLSFVYEHNKTPGSSLRMQIAKDFNILPRSVQIWFQNRRAKDRKDQIISSAFREPKKKKGAEDAKEGAIPFLNSDACTYDEYFEKFSKPKTESL